MKKLGLIIAGLLIMSLLVSIIGCAQPTPPPPPAEEEEEEEEVTPPPEPFKPIKLKYAWSASLKPGYFGSVSGYQLWADCVKEATDGRLIIELYPNESLHKVTAAFEACGKGVSDIAWGYPGYTPGILPMEGIWSLPPTTEDCYWENVKDTVIYFQDRLKPGAESFYTKFLESDWKQMGLQVLAPMSVQPYIIFSARKPINKIEDFKGITMRAHSAEVAAMLKPLGVLSVSITYADAYEALQKGIMDCAALAWSIPLSLGWYEVAKPGYIVDCGGLTKSMYYEMINEAKYDSLPPELKKTLAELTWYWLGIRTTYGYSLNVPIYEAEYTRLGIQLTYWPKEEKERLLNEVKLPRWDNWVKDIEAKYQKGTLATEMIAWYKDQLSKFEYGQEQEFPQSPEMGGDTEAWKALIGPMGTDAKRGLGKLGPGGTLGLGIEYYPGIKFQFLD